MENSKQLQKWIYELELEVTSLDIKKAALEEDISVLQLRYDICDRVSTLNESNKPELSSRIRERANRISKDLKRKKIEQEEFEVVFNQRLDEINVINDEINSRIE